MIDVLFYHSSIGDLKIEYDLDSIIGARFVSLQDYEVYQTANFSIVSGKYQENTDAMPIRKMIINWLDSYFGGNFTALNSIPLKLNKTRIKSDFAENILFHLKDRVNPGQFTSYKELSLSIFCNSKYARSIGNVMRNNPIVLFIPCHRVVPNSSISNVHVSKFYVAGAAGKYMGGEGDAIKEKLLKHELKFS